MNILLGIVVGVTWCFKFGDGALEAGTANFIIIFHGLKLCSFVFLA